MTQATRMAEALRTALTPWVGRPLTVRERAEQQGSPAMIHSGRVVRVCGGGVVFHNDHGYTQFFSWADWMTGLVDSADLDLATQLRAIRRELAVPVAPFDPTAFLRRLAADPSVSMTRWALRVGAGM